VQNLDSEFSEVELKLGFVGPLGSFDTFQISVFAHNSNYPRAQLWYRICFICYAFFLWRWPSAGNFARRFSAGAVLFCYFPATVFLLVERSALVQILDFLIQDFLSLFVFDLWVVSKMKIGGMFGFEFVFGNVIVVCAMVWDCIVRAQSEFSDIAAWASQAISTLDYAMVGVAIAMMVVHYFVFLSYPRVPRKSAVDLATYSCFIALFCHFFDELIVRLKLLKVLTLGKPLRQFAELAALYFVTDLEVEVDRVEEPPRKNETEEEFDQHEPEPRAEGDSDLVLEV
jgi:hypothetical protein